MTASMLQMVVQAPEKQHCSCMGFHSCSTHSCSTHNGKQRRFGRLATSTIASTCMTHLLLLWGRDRSQVGGRKRTCKGHTGRAMFSKRSNKRSLQHESTVACSTHEHAGWCCRGCLMLWKCSSMPRDTAPSPRKYALAKRCLVGTRSM
jgi:hypothetical protein